MPEPAHSLLAIAAMHRCRRTQRAGTTASRFTCLIDRATRAATGSADARPRLAQRRTPILFDTPSTFDDVENSVNVENPATQKMNYHFITSTYAIIFAH
ncbi:protein of unknown function [Pararobbsia alpina]